MLHWYINGIQCIDSVSVGMFFLFFRRDIAGALGYEHFAEMSMEHKMAGNVQTVLSMIDM